MDIRKSDVITLLLDVLRMRPSPGMISQILSLLCLARCEGICVCLVDCLSLLSPGSTIGSNRTCRATCSRRILRTTPTCWTRRLSGRCATSLNALSLRSCPASTVETPRYAPSPQAVSSGTVAISFFLSPSYKVRKYSNVCSIGRCWAQDTLDV